MVQNALMSESKLSIDTDNKLDQSNGQGRIRQPFAKEVDCSNYVGMDEGISIETIREALRRAMDKRVDYPDGSWSVRNRKCTRDDMKR